MNTSSAAITKQTILVTCLLSLLPSCSDNSAGKHDQVICPSQKQSWLLASQSFFLGHPEPMETSAFAARLNSFLRTSRNGCAAVELSQQQGRDQNDDVGNGLAGDTLPSTYVDESNRLEAANSAKVERRIQREQLLLTHQMTLLGKVYFPSKDTEAIPEQNEWRREWQNYVNSLTPLPLGISTDIDIYESDDTRRLFAYRVNTSKQRIFAIFNLSFDEQEAPLPFGFMSSTKVRLWRSDDTTIREFVTNDRLFIKPLTAIVVVVG